MVSPKMLPAKYSKPKKFEAADADGTFFLGRSRDRRCGATLRLGVFATSFRGPPVANANQQVIEVVYEDRQLSSTRN